MRDSQLAILSATMNYERQSPDASAISLPFFMAIKTEMNLFQRKLLLTSIKPYGGIN